MNQILDTNFKGKHKINKRFFKFQFVISFIMFGFFIFLLIYYIFSWSNQEKFSKQLIENYDIYKLYSNNRSYNQTKTSNNDNLFGIIEIPKINLYYPVFSNINEEYLKTAPCKMYGNSPNEKGNICIAGHNYNNNMFFSKINTLTVNDEIYLYDISSNKYVYKVFELSEVLESDLSPIFDYNGNFKQLTLITCNNLNSNRIIVKAKQ